MIEFELTPKHAGIVIWGDTWSLQAMYELIHKINESSPIIEDKEGFFLGLAQSHVEKVINSRCRYFIDLPPKERLKMLPAVLESLDPMYEILGKHFAAGRPDAISVATFKRYADDSLEWPEFRW